MSHWWFSARLQHRRYCSIALSPPYSVAHKKHTSALLANWFDSHDVYLVMTLYSNQTEIQENFNPLRPGDPPMHQGTGLPLVQIMACCPSPVQHANTWTNAILWNAFENVTHSFQVSIHRTGFPFPFFLKYWNFFFSIQHTGLPFLFLSTGNPSICSFACPISFIIL